LFIRATFGKSFRAPDLLQSFGTNAGVTDSINVPGFVTNSVRAVTSPNPGLKPEQATWTTKYNYQVRADLPVVKGLGHVNNNVTVVAPMPKLKANFVAGWQKDGHYAQATLRYISGMLSDTIPADDPRQTNSDYFQLDLLYSFTFNLAGGPMTLRASINNVWDERPPLLTGVQPAIPGVYDIRGRVFSLGLSKAF
jgi:iron complex outermembrane recepter protein